MYTDSTLHISSLTSSHPRLSLELAEYRRSCIIIELIIRKACSSEINVKQMTLYRSTPLKQGSNIHSANEPEIGPRGASATKAFHSPRPLFSVAKTRQELTAPSFRNANSSSSLSRSRDGARKYISSFIDVLALWQQIKDLNLCAGQIASVL